MAGHVISSHVRLGNGRIFGIPTDPLRWRIEELESYRDFVVRQIQAQIDDRLGVHDWPALHDPAASLARFQEEFDELLDQRAELLQDEFAVRREANWSNRILHETPVVRAQLERPDNPTIPLLQFRLARLFDRLEHEKGPAEIDAGLKRTWEPCWIRRLAAGGSPRQAGSPLTAPFLSGVRGSEDQYCADPALREYECWLHVESGNKTNLNRLRLVSPSREIEFSNTLRARALLVAIRRTFWRLVLFAIADQLEVVFFRAASGKGFYDQRFGLRAQEQGQALWVDESGRADIRACSLLARPCASIPVRGWSHPRLAAARALFSRIYETEGRQSILASALGHAGLFRRLDEPVPAPAPSTLTPREAEASRMLEPFDRNAERMWRVWTFDSFRDFPVAEFTSFDAATRFLECNCTTEGIRVRVA